ncbi:YcgN family cysteine cluster protein [Sphingopyxis sp. 22461]|uniref:YcgN family cysteine cluster protein n=1 Tax=Sphingopyxis sp. 22461 TaxID=3453923 RepID=UPI003F84E8B9
MAREAQPFWEAPLATLDAGQWEALCDGCGKCCLHKLEDEDTGRIYPTNVACRLLDLKTARCGDYKHRRRHVPDCLTLTKGKIADIEWLPQTCAYRLRAEGEPLPDWHYLVCGDRDAVHRAGESIVGWTVGEDMAGPLENHLVERVV